MKIVKYIRDIYQEHKPLYHELETEVKENLKPRVEEKNWFFISRIKALESFALKIETGRVAKPTKLEDFFACTIIVPTTVDICQAKKMVLCIYKFHSRRPTNDSNTHKGSSDFVFDDLRLYVMQGALTSGKNQQLNEIVFEVQIKTILQYAWSIATHDLIYKSDTINWPRERIAFQVKAMLEHAEVTITKTDLLKDAPNVAKTNPRTDDVCFIIKHLNQIWTSEQLPQDIKRLAETIFEVLHSCELDVKMFPRIIETEKHRLSSIPLNLSPYALTIQALAQNKPVELQQMLENKKTRTIVIHSGMELPEWILNEHPRILNIGSS